MSSYKSQEIFDNGALGVHEIALSHHLSRNGKQENMEVKNPTGLFSLPKKNPQFDPDCPCCVEGLKISQELKRQLSNNKTLIDSLHRQIADLKAKLPPKKFKSKKLSPELEKAVKDDLRQERAAGVETGEQIWEDWKTLNVVEDREVM
jgi:hypothetical protein